MSSLEKIRYKIHKTDNNNYIDEKIDNGMCELIQRNLYDFLKENSHKNKIYGQNLSQTYFEANFLEHFEGIPVFQEFAVDSKNNKINRNFPLEIHEVKEEEIVNKNINRRKSFTFEQRNKIKYEEINEKEEFSIANETKFSNFPKGYSQIKRASTPSFENNLLEKTYNLEMLEESPLKKDQNITKSSKMIDFEVKTAENMNKNPKNLQVLMKNKPKIKNILFIHK